MYARKLLEGLLPDHDCSKVGRVTGQNQQAEDCPQVHEEPASPALGRLAGDGAAEEDGIAQVEGWRVGEDPHAVASMWRHAKGALPLIKREKECCDVKCHKYSHPHGPVQRPHEGANRCCRVLAAHQYAQAGGKEGAGEVHYFATCWVDTEAGDGHVGNTVQEVSHQPRPATPLPCSILSVPHDVEIKFEVHVLGQLLQQVDAVPIAALAVIQWKESVVALRPACKEPVQALWVVGPCIQAVLSRRAVPVLVHFPREDKRVLHQRDHTHATAWHREPRPPAAALTALLGLSAMTPRQALPQTLLLYVQLSSLPAAHCHPGWLAHSVPPQAPHMDTLRGEHPWHVPLHTDRTCQPCKGRVREEPEGERTKDQDRYTQNTGETLQ